MCYDCQKEYLIFSLYLNSIKDFFIRFNDFVKSLLLFRVEKLRQSTLNVVQNVQIKGTDIVIAYIILLE